MSAVAVVTGGSGGLGRAVCDALAARGHMVVSWSRSDGVDVGDEASVEQAASRLSRLDVLVNNASLLVMNEVANMSADEWDACLRTGLRGPFLCSRAAFRLMEPGSAIVNVSSLSGVQGAEKFPRMGAYVAAKSGLAGLTEVLAVEGRGRGIRVNAISPGSIDTPMSALAGVPGAKLDPVEVARVIAWLASPESAPLTGANLRMEA